MAAQVTSTSGQRGFSLLELLVTLFVIVIVTSLVTLNITSGVGDIQLETQMRELADAGSYAVDEAQLQVRDYGLALQTESVAGETVYRYSWFRRDDRQGWQQLTDTAAGSADIFAGARLPPGLELQLDLEGAPAVALPDSAQDDTPQVIFYASGESTPGSLDVRRRVDGALLWRLQWDLLGRFSLLPRGEEVTP